jgi:hypothetical protein
MQSVIRLPLHSMHLPVWTDATDVKLLHELQKPDSTDEKLPGT